VLRLTEAADGFLARVRLPGGLVSAAQLRVLARLADRLGDGRAELTSRGNVQLRGLPATAAPALTGELEQAGLLPSLSHDRVRNVLASPLAGLGHGPDLTGLVRALDAELCARPALAELPGRFLFAIDDGRGDVAGPGADTPAADVTATVLAGRDAARDAARDVVKGAVKGAVVNGLATGDGPDGVVAAMLACAEAFLELRAEHGGTAWRISDLPGGADRVRATVAGRLGLTGGAPTDHPAADHPAADHPAADHPAAIRPRPVGLVTGQQTRGGTEQAATVRDDAVDSAVRPGPGSAVLLAPLGRLTAAQLSWIAARLAGQPARVTPWRSIVLPELADAAGALRAAAGLGLGTGAGSPWLRVTACAGRPGCASALGDVQADAAALAARWPGRLVHVSGCGRRCGRPAATEIDVTATSEGYQVAGV
jgi:precorrin-3B synthase